mmetsp:Transcript_80231/g.214374  ORF Transcript_80231/g.214374 Transcript_80231/m.214374 type:complete len:229 (-) Transcript_80231:1397-2083(-)
MSFNVPPSHSSLSGSTSTCPVESCGSSSGGYGSSSTGSGVLGFSGTSPHPSSSSAGFFSGGTGQVTVSGLVTVIFTGLASLVAHAGVLMPVIRISSWVISPWPGTVICVSFPCAAIAVTTLAGGGGGGGGGEQSRRASRSSAVGDPATTDTSSAAPPLSAAAIHPAAGGRGSGTADDRRKLPDIVSSGASLTTSPSTSPQGTSLNELAPVTCTRNAAPDTSRKHELAP